MNEWGANSEVALEKGRVLSTLMLIIILDFSDDSGQPCQADPICG